MKLLQGAGVLVLAFLGMWVAGHLALVHEVMLDAALAVASACGLTLLSAGLYWLAGCARPARPEVRVRPSGHAASRPARYCVCGALATTAIDGRPACEGCATGHSADPAVDVLPASWPGEPGRPRSGKSTASWLDAAGREAYLSAMYGAPDPDRRPSADPVPRELRALQQDIDS